MERVSKDARFSHITKDLRFRRMSKNTQKVKIDKRFKDMFTDKRFKLKYSVDKRGKPMNMTTNENLKKYYELSDSMEEDNVDDGKDSEDDKDESDDDEEAAKKSGNQTKTKNKETTKLKMDNVKEGLNSDSVKKESSVPDKKKKKQCKMKDSVKERKKTMKVRSDSEEEVLEQNLGKASKKKAMKSRKKKTEIKVTEEDSSSDDEEDKKEEEFRFEENSDDEDSGLGEGPDLARGEGNVETSSSEEDDDSEEEEENQEEFDHGWGELDKDVHTTEELGHRLSVCNMDWDRIKSQDIFVLLHSFVPTGGSIKSVKVYPSEFGLQRMKEEALSGPTELVQDKRENPPEAEGEEEDYEENQGTRYHREKLRRYQLNRLKYYYAVVDTDSIGTASKIYEECDGMEYESSSTKLDLRFIPDDMEFTEEPKSVCTEMPAAYNPSLFVSTALAQSKVNLTWDETDQDRIKVTMMNSSQRKKTDDVNEEDFQAYLASSSEEEEDKDDDHPVVDEDDNDNEDDNEESQIQKYRSLLQSLDNDKDQKKKKEVEMEVTWEPGLKETTEKIVKHKEKTKDQTPWDQYLMKKKEKRQRKREERMSGKMTSDKEPEEQAAFSDDDLPAGVDEDPFFKQSLDSEDGEDRKPKAESKKTKKKKRKEKTLKSMTKDTEGELELLMMDEETDNRKHFNLKSIMKDSKKKKKLSGDQKPEEDFQINVKDDRFTAIFDSHLYNIDPSAPEFKKTKSMEAIIEEKLKRRTSGKTQKTVSGQKRKSESDHINTGHLAKKLDSESISSLIHSVKSKTQTFQNKKTKKYDISSLMSPGLTQSTFYVTEEQSILVYDVDTVIVRISCKDVTLTVCGDSSWTEWLVFWSRSMASELESQFPGLIDHHYCSSS
ncbi:ESF1 homolog [Saccostrea echinata]|uniref:ESF1 homolog n=1 Tax=Saccostrea echinata TaxID=191078 RepID=UPI002A7FEED7|nr:ESF1 homolog [Saccostrea echinata]